MKQITILYFFLAIFSCKAQQQTNAVRMSHAYTYKSLNSFKTDTFAYIYHNFKECKGQYINKPFTLFLNDLDFPIVAYTNATTFSNKFVYIGITIYSYDFQNTLIRKRLKLRPFNITIKWAKLISQEIVNSLLIKNKMYWTKDETALFKDMIIEDLILGKFDNPEHYYN